MIFQISRLQSLQKNEITHMKLNRYNKSRNLSFIGSFVCTVLASGISPETTGVMTTPSPPSPPNYPDATVTQVDAAIEMKNPITRCPAPRERGKDSNIKALILIDITVVVVIVIAIVVVGIGEFCGDCDCTPCLRTYCRRE